MKTCVRRVVVAGLLGLLAGFSPFVGGVAHSETGGTALNDFFSLSSPELSWQQIFNSDGSLNPLPDRSGAEFFPDNISAGIATDMSTLNNGVVFNDTVLSQNDLGNTFLYYTIDQSGDLIVYLGVARLGTTGGESFIDFTLSQSPFFVRQGNPWPVFGSYTPGDLTIRLSFVDGNLSSVETSRWTEAEYLQTINSSWPIADSACSGQPNNLAFCAGTLPSGLPPTNQDVWDRYYNKVSVPAANQFVEVGVNVSKLLGVNASTLSLTVKTPEDIVLAPLTIQGRTQP